MHLKNIKNDINNIRKKKILFLTGDFQIGGIQTYLIRLLTKLKDYYAITVLITRNANTKNNDNPYFIQQLNELNINLKYLDKKNYLTPLIKLIQKFNFRFLSRKDIKFLDSFDFIHATDTINLLHANEFVKHSKRKIPITIGVYHSLEYIYKQKNYQNKVFRNVFNRLSPNNVFCCNEYTSIFYEKNYHKSFNTIIPIGINIKNENRKPKFNSKKIVSVGRLVKFKTYNENVIKILDDLYNNGYELEYHIYGEGDYEYLKKMSNNIKSKVVFHKDVEYSQLNEIFSDAKIFIGSGTTLLESAAFGLPSIIGIESISKPLTYGFLSSMNGYTYNENIPDIPKVPIYDCILKVLKMNELQYFELCSLEREKAKIFSIEQTSILFKKYLEGADINFNPLEFSKIKYNYSRTIDGIKNRLKLSNSRRDKYINESY